MPRTDWERIHNQLRIHWNWLSKCEDYREVFNYLVQWGGDGYRSKIPGKMVKQNKK